jgi:hypothetical protein
VVVVIVIVSVLVGGLVLLEDGFVTGVLSGDIVIRRRLCLRGWGVLPGV